MPVGKVDGTMLLALNDSSSSSSSSSSSFYSYDRAGGGKEGITQTVDDWSVAVVVTAGDFTVRGGSGGSEGGLGTELRASARALEWRLPYVRLLDASGGSVATFESIGRTYLPDGNQVRDGS